MYPAHDRYWDIYQNRSVHIASPVGQAQFMLIGYLYMMERSPQEWMLLCRFADTIQVIDGERELRELRRLAEHLNRRAFELKYGNADPLVSIEVEREIVLRRAPCYGEGLGHDIAPAVRILKAHEQKRPVFTQAERNLMLQYAYFIGDPKGTRRLAQKIATHSLSNQDIAAICASIETVDLGWSGLEQLEGSEAFTEEPPTFRFDGKDSENPLKVYPRFTYYLSDMPKDAVLLQSGVILRPCPDDEEGRWRSELLKIDQTHTAPRYYAKTGRNSYEMAERACGPADLEVLLDGQDTLPPIPEQMRKATQKTGRHPPGERPRGGNAR